MLDMTQKVENNKERHVPGLILGSSAAPPKICQILRRKLHVLISILDIAFKHGDVNNHYDLIPDELKGLCQVIGKMRLSSFRRCLEERVIPYYFRCAVSQRAEN